MLAQGNFLFWASWFLGLAGIFLEYLASFLVTTVRMKRKLSSCTIMAVKQVFGCCLKSIAHDVVLSWSFYRIMMVSPFHPCSKSCSTGTHNETVKNLSLFSSIINRIMMELRLRISIPWECFKFFNRIEPFYHIYTVALLLHESPNLIGTLGIAEFGPKWSSVFQSNSMSLC